MKIVTIGKKDLGFTYLNERITFSTIWDALLSCFAYGVILVVLYNYYDHLDTMLGVVISSISQISYLLNEKSTPIMEFISGSKTAYIVDQPIFFPESEAIEWISDFGQLPLTIRINPSKNCTVKDNMMNYYGLVILQLKRKDNINIIHFSILTSQ